MNDILNYVAKYNDEYIRKYMPHHSLFRIYLLSDNLTDSASKLLHQDCEITICSCSYKDYNNCNSIEATRDHYRSCRKPRKGVPFTPGIFDIRSFHDHLLSDKSDDASVCDVAIIMGHSSALFAEDYNVIRGLTQMKPTVVAFVGCSEGNARFGPIANISHMLSCVCEVTPIVGFYQRRIYLSELQNTSLIIGLRYYAGLVKHFQVTADQPQIRKQIARCAFGLAAAQLASSSTDPSVLINDNSPATNIMQTFKFNLRDIPLSYMQLAMCNPLVAGSEGIDIKGNENDLDEWCKKEIESRKLHKLVPLMCEIDLIRLAGETLKNLKSGKWKEIDHLQFLTAVLRGHWGMNSLAVVKEWAIFHLVEVMNAVKLQNKFIYSLHQYKLCCMCFVLLCDDHFVKFDNSYSIIACTSHPCPVLDRLYDVTTDGYLISPSLYTHKLNESPLPFPDEPELPWVQLYRHCRYIPDFLQLYNNNNTTQILNHTSCGPVRREWYNYTRDEFLLAMGALSDYVKRTEDKLVRESHTVLHILTELENNADPQSSESERPYIAALPSQQKTDLKDNLSKLQNEELMSLNRKVILEHPQLFVHLRKRVIRPTVFSIKLFHNADVSEDGYMKYFDENQLQNTTETSTDNEHRAETLGAANEEIIDKPHQQNVAERITFYEMKVILDYDYAKEKCIKDDELFMCYQDEQATQIVDKSWFRVTKRNATTSGNLVNYCRFVFAKFNNPTVKDEITGILFFTDNHYGHTLIEFDKQHMRKICKDCLYQFKGEVSLHDLCTSCSGKIRGQLYLPKLCTRCLPKVRNIQGLCNLCRQKIKGNNLCDKWFLQMLKSKLCSQCKENTRAKVYLRHLGECCKHKLKGNIRDIFSSCRYKMQEITITQARLQNMLCEQCWDTLSMEDCCRETLCNEHLKEEDKLCAACYKKCESIVKELQGKSKQEKSEGWPKFKDACTECQNKMLAQAKKVQFPFKKIGRLTLKYNDDNQLNEILLSKCT